MHNELLRETIAHSATIWSAKELRVDLAFLLAYLMRVKRRIKFT